MKISNKILNIILIIIFVISVGYAFITVYQLPNDIAIALRKNGAQEIAVAYKIAFPTFVTLIFTLLVVLALIYSLSEALTTGRMENIVYVEKKSTEKISKEQQNIIVKSPTERVERFKAKLEEISQLPELEKVRQAFTYICHEVDAAVGVVYKAKTEEKYIEYYTGFAFVKPDSQTVKYEFGEGLAGQVAYTQKPIVIQDVPKDYIKVYSGLGKATAQHLAIIPMIYPQGKLKGVVEIAAFTAFTESDLAYLKEATEIISRELV
jgi:putative methionine-R-sulfoxide reductase with GAF domain